jgi:hypothetical protein
MRGILLIILSLLATPASWAQEECTVVNRPFFADQSAATSAIGEHAAAGHLKSPVDPKFQSLLEVKTRAFTWRLREADPAGRMVEEVEAHATGLRFQVTTRNCIDQLVTIVVRGGAPLADPAFLLRRAIELLRLLAVAAYPGTDAIVRLAELLEHREQDPAPVELGSEFDVAEAASMSVARSEADPRDLVIVYRYLP